MLVPSVAQQTLEQTSFSTIGEPASPNETHMSMCLTFKECRPAVGEPQTSFCLVLSEQTAGAVIQMCGLPEEAQRKVWPVKPDSQVLRVLQEAELQPLTQELGNVSLCDDDSCSPSEPPRLLVLLSHFTAVSAHTSQGSTTLPPPKAFLLLFPSTCDCCSQTFHLHQGRR